MKYLLSFILLFSLVTYGQTKDDFNKRGISKYNDGDNGLKNLKPQPSKDNLEYNKDNLIGV